MKYRVLLVSLILVSFTFNNNLQAQTLDKGQVEDEVIYDGEWTGGFFLSTAGWGLDYTRLKVKNNKKKTLWQISFQELRGKTEKRTPGQPSPNGTYKGYFYGKQNKFFTLDFLLGRQHKLTSHGRRKGVELAYNYKVGATLGVAKPYYMQMYVEELGGEVAVKYDGENDDVFFASPIIAGSGFSKGLDELKLFPGGIAKASFIVDFSSRREFLKTVEIGGQLQVFYKRVPIMVLEDDSFIHPNLFLKIMFGKKY